jgi:cyclopropane fatty-acyl-phospholipid synthase-like methyltransferase
MKKRQNYFKNINKNNNVTIPDHTAYAWADDPKHLVFSLSRYKFVAKMLQGYKNVLEIGAGDGFQSRLVDKEVKNLVLSEVFQENKDLFQKNKFNKNTFIIHDFIKESIKQKFDAIYLLDVIEHIQKKQMNKFTKNIVDCLKKQGVIIIGTPTIESQKYASKFSKRGHVNCYTKSGLKKFMQKYFRGTLL